MTSTQPDRPSSVTRRHVLAGAATLAGTAALSLATSTHTEDGFSALRDRWTTQLVGGGSDDPGTAAARARTASRATAYLRQVAAAPSSQAFDDLVLDPAQSSHITETMHRLRAMALAWATPHTSTHGSAELVEATAQGLAVVDRAVGRDGASATAWSNWWDHEIGVPRALADCLVLMHSALGASTRAAYSSAIRAAVPDAWHHNRTAPRPHRATGANLVDLSRTVVIEGIATSDADRVADGAAALRSACSIVSDGDGVRVDGSFIQHSHVPNTGAYGVTWLDGISRLALLLTGTRWELDRRAWQVLEFAVDHAFSPVLHDGRVMEFVRGREISRERSTGHSAALTVVAAVLRLTESGQLSAATAQAWHDRCLGWVRRARPGYDPLHSTDPPAAQALSGLSGAGSAAGSPEPDSSVVFWEMARAVHRRSGWAFAVSMSADHVARYESMNGENLRGLYTGSGMTYLYDGDDTQFADHYWPTVDPTHLPGTTAVQAPIVLDQATTSPPAKGAWAGGPVLDEYCAPAMSISAPESGLTGQASWFCFDRYVLALGTGISCSTTGTVETTVENRLLHDAGARALTVDGEVTLAAVGDQRLWDNPRWAHLDGVGGYVFVGDTRLRGLRQARSGRWRDINEAGDTRVITRHYLSLVVEHGTAPVSAAYAYLLVPGATAAQTAALAGARDVWIQAAGPACHAVAQDGTGVTMATFWQPGETSSIRVDAPCGVIVRETAEGISVAVADLARSARPIKLVLIGRTELRLATTSAVAAVRASGADTEVTVSPAYPGGTSVARLVRKV